MNAELAETISGIKSRQYAQELTRAGEGVNVGKVAIYAGGVVVLATCHCCCIALCSCMLAHALSVATTQCD